MASNGNINPNQIQHEIETLKSQKQLIEARISLLQSQLHQQQHSSCTNESCPPIPAVQGTQEEDKKLSDEAARIYLKVKDDGYGYEVVFRVKSSTQFKKLMNAYRDHRSVTVDLRAYSLKFFFEGRVIRADQTPDELKMKDGDEIDAVLDWFPRGEKRRRTTEMEMSERREEDKKPGDHIINLKVLGQDDNDAVFRIKRSTQFKKLMNAYCAFQSVDFWSIAFLYNGRRIREDHTPDELEMKDGDVIHAIFKMWG